jgi:hypothetical protein
LKPLTNDIVDTDQNDLLDFSAEIGELENFLKK